ncbi:hypothetical protein KUTeg_003978 [Tegillarca granosa]|uniref:BTB domain-containing protein n=1 Tax=Tegillarca granosa TaxID=220873 RepID=A0ABQ9FQH3_TEGGR|nr:hypothetical protein KUTeg_003978 [Tegillarca granosa]
MTRIINSEIVEYLSIEKRNYMDHSIPTVSKCLLNGIRKLYESDRYTDVTIYVENQPLSCHKVILSAVSGYFDAMFSSGMREATSEKIALQNISLKTFKDILSFVYSGKDIINHETAEELLVASSMLQMDCLQVKCEKFMVHNIDNNNCLNMWKLGKTLNCGMIVKVSKPFVLDHFQEIAESEDFLRLEKDDVLSFVHDENLNVAREEFVCDVIFKWIKKDEEKRKTCVTGTIYEFKVFVNDFRLHFRCGRL